MYFVLERPRWHVAGTHSLFHGDLYTCSLDGETYLRRPPFFFCLSLFFVFCFFIAASYWTFQSSTHIPWRRSHCTELHIRLKLTRLAGKCLFWCLQQRQVPRPINLFSLVSASEECKTTQLGHRSKSRRLPCLFICTQVDLHTYIHTHTHT